MTTLIDLEPLRGGDITEERALNVYKTLVTRLNGCASAADLKDEEAEEIVRAAALLRSGDQTFGTMMIDLVGRATKANVLVKVVGAARSLREDPEVSPFLNHLKERLLLRENGQSDGSIDEFYGEDFLALNEKVIAACEGLELADHEPPSK